jgi:hypothetical protein
MPVMPITEDQLLTLISETSRIASLGEQMVAHTQHDERVTISLTDRNERVLYRQICRDGFVACAKATIAVAQREERRAGDTFTLTVTTAGDGAIHQPRETD